MTKGLKDIKPLSAIDDPNRYIGEDGLEVEEILQQFIVRYEDAYVAHRVASAIEYLLRAPLKNGYDDIEKAGTNIDQIMKYRKKNDN